MRGLSTAGVSRSPALSLQGPASEQGRWQRSPAAAERDATPPIRRTPHNADILIPKLLSDLTPCYPSFPDLRSTRSRKMKMLSNIFLLLTILSSLLPALFAGPFHAQCRLEWNFGIPCFNVYTSLVTQIKLWTSVDNCIKEGGERCLYELQSANEHYIVAKHRNLMHNYVDDLTFKLRPVGVMHSCQVSAFSVSEPWYIVQDKGINYCNLHNLAEGSELVSAPGFTESTNDFKCTQYSTANCTIY
ncbi:PREDICTED: uncharacterized protein LOC108793090 [Nanorana parkeri]|uniref:uncharacterized protein LOC108793090 n=1 Tax=Nanorana parkeri TaxID=125878 RepID=UPI0008543951|nr:PREDICTED: uncharacterized protein LOC108793090 [Nanorana parkeri]